MAATGSRWMAVLVVAAMLTVTAGCSDTAPTAAPERASAAPSSTASTTTTPASSTNPAVQPEDGTEFCQIFQGLSARRAAGGDGFERYADEASWTVGIENVEHIAASAPDAIAVQAATYAQLVKERKDLAASYDYQPVPQDAKLTFGRAHAAMQQQANELIAFAKTNCSGVS